MNSAPTVIPAAIEQHAEEAAFLWRHRSFAVHMPHYSLEDIARLDNRVEAHIDGLRVAGEFGWELCKEALEENVFAAAVLAYESDDAGRIRTVLDCVINQSELCREVVSALGWMPLRQTEKHVLKLWAADSPVLRRVGVAAGAVHRHDLGRSLTDALSVDDTYLRARALRAVGQLGRLDLLSFLRANFEDEETKCQFCAAWSAALLGDKAGLPLLRTLVEADSPHKQDAMDIAARVSELSSAHEWRFALAGNPETRRIAVRAAGLIGDSVSIPWLIEQMAIPEMARLAGEALSMITGVNISYENLEGQWPEGFEAGPTEDPEDENVKMDPDEDLPWPKPELIEKWWGQHRSNFQTGTRYLCGKPKTIVSLQDVLRTGYQRQRAAAAIELAIRQPGTPLFEVRARGLRQQQLLGLPITRG